MLFLFAFTLFISAALLFLVQPMVGKMILPRLGGTPAVWNTCMVFFQGMLLLGYAYAHAAGAWGRRRQLVLQFAVVAVPLVALPFGLKEWSAPVDRNPMLQVLLLLLGMVGLPFFVVATTAPLLQKWFAKTSHRAARDPYFLYAASNLGSMLALVAYPMVVEPWFTLETQTWIWAIGYAALAILVIGCGVAAWRSVPRPTFTAARNPQDSKTRPGAWKESAQITAWRRLRWVGLAAAPSSLMLGVTTYLTADVAAIPLFWVVPLALYLLTFILAFARWPVVWTKRPHTLLLYVQPGILMFLVLVLVGNWRGPVWLLFASHLAAFFATSLACHGELARDRPSPRFLTEFYLWISVGGVLGGLFNALVAPFIFWTGVVEYPLAMMFACVLRPSLVGPRTLLPGDSSDRESTPLGRMLTILTPPAIGLAAFWLAFYSGEGTLRSLTLAIPVVLVLLLARRPVRFGLALGCLLLGVSVYDWTQEYTIYQSRGFFGIVKVNVLKASYDNDRTWHLYHSLVHGRIEHGRQDLDPKLRRNPLGYFHPGTGVGQVFAGFDWPDQRLAASLAGLGNVPWGVLTAIKSEPPYAVIGLGAGALASHARPTQHLVFYEIDPLVTELSLPTKGGKPIFTYLQDAKDRGAKVDCILGDGRLSLKKAPDGYFHILVVDVFNSDAIPVHFLTAEAIDLYMSKLVDGGLLVFNCTNRFVDLRQVLADLAKDRGLEWRYYGDYGLDAQRKQIPDRFGSDWFVMRRPGPALEGSSPLEQRLNANWRAIPGLGRPAWTDNYSNLFRVMLW
ncbi:MAG: hypothetical protein HY040_06410 [Planctomycetes bacterium]|nr:hypothetical protein [Planctomycetota bacterium]